MGVLVYSSHLLKVLDLRYRASERNPDCVCIGKINLSAGRDVGVAA